MTSMSMSFISNNDVPVFFTIKKDQPQVPNRELESKLLTEKYVDIKQLRKSFSNCSLLTDEICDNVQKKINLSKSSVNKLEYIVNELVENFYKHSLSIGNQSLKIYSIPHRGYITLVIRASNASDRFHVKGIIESFRLIRKECEEKEHFKYKKDFFHKRGHMGWITITKLNTMVHITAQKKNRQEYDIETCVLLSGNEFN